MRELISERSRSDASSLDSRTEVSTTAAGPARLIWFVHFHKAGGTSVAELARRNGEVLYTPNGNGNPLSTAGKTLRLWELSEAGIEDFVATVRSQGVTFIATEFGVPDLETLRRLPPVTTVTVMRDPIARIMSNFAFDYTRGYTRATSVADFVDDTEGHTLSNYYSRQLLGGSWQSDEDVSSAVDRARQQAAHIDHTLLLEGPAPFRSLEQILGWSITSVHAERGRHRLRDRLLPAGRAVSRGKLDRAARLLRNVPRPTEAELDDLKESNAVDIALFDRIAQELRAAAVG